MEEIFLTAEEKDEGRRVDVFVAECLEEISRSRVQSLLESENILVNGKKVKSNYKLKNNDVVSVSMPPLYEAEIVPEDIPLDIVYEDEDIIIVNKQAGIIVHPTKGHPEHTIANAVMKYMEDTDQSFKVRFANRIDMDTTGMIIVCKNANAQNELSSQMRRNTVVKRYYALVEGNIAEHHFTVELPVGRPDSVSIRRTVMYEGGKDAFSEFNVLGRYPSKRYGDHTLVEVILHTGRTHQIRVHLSHIGHPIAGDELYEGGTFLIKRQALHASYIEFDHPMTKERVHFKTDIPEDMKKAIEELKNSAV